MKEYTYTLIVAPSQGRELKQVIAIRLMLFLVAPSQGRELKHIVSGKLTIDLGRPFTGA